jgi:Spy/CpxP family protein refolding chaperone
MAALAIAVLASTSTLSATQGSKTPPGIRGVKWWQSDYYIKELGLTAEQTRRMEEIFQGALPTLKVQMTTLEEAEAKFERLVERGDDNQVMEQVNLVEAARADLNKTRTLMLLGMRKVLTSNQWARFTALQAAQNQPAKESKVPK